MYIVLGANGHIGSAVATTLLAADEPVTVVTRDASRATHWAERGATVAEADLHDPAGLRKVLSTGRRAFLLNPPADPTGDTEAEERATIQGILDALDGSDLEHVVALSTYGVQRGERIGDLGTLHDLEAGLENKPATVLRSAYLLSNYDGMLADGVLPSMIPADHEMAMVAPADVGRVAADLLRAPTGGVQHVEGPARYTPADIAAVLDAELAVPPRDQWADIFRGLGFSDVAAESYAGMVALSIDGDWELPADPIRGRITPAEYFTTRA